MQRLIHDLFETIECVRPNRLPTLTVWSSSPKVFLNQTHPQSEPDAVSAMGSGAQISGRLNALLAVEEYRTLLPETLSARQKRAIRELIAEFYSSHQNQPAAFLLHPCLMPNHTVQRVFLGGDADSRRTEYVSHRSRQQVQLRFRGRYSSSMRLDTKRFDWKLPEGLEQRDVHFQKVVEDVGCLDPTGTARLALYREQVAPAPVHLDLPDEALLSRGVAPAARDTLFSIWKNRTTGMYSVHPRGWRDSSGELDCVTEIGVVDAVLLKFWRFSLVTTRPGRTGLMTDTLMLAFDREGGRVIQIVGNSGPCPADEYDDNTCIGTAFRSVL